MTKRKPKRKGSEELVIIFCDRCGRKMWWHNGFWQCDCGRQM